MSKPCLKKRMLEAREVRYELKIYQAMRQNGGVLVLVAGKRAICG